MKYLDKHGNVHNTIIGSFIGDIFGKKRIQIEDINDECDNLQNDLLHYYRLLDFINDGMFLSTENVLPYDKLCKQLLHKKANEEELQKYVNNIIESSIIITMELLNHSRIHDNDINEIKNVIVNSFKLNNQL